MGRSGTASPGTASRLRALCAALSSPFPTVVTRNAADEFLSSNGGRRLDDVFHHLVWQRTLPTVLGHLAAAGADLDRLTVQPERLRNTFPRGYKPIWDLDTAGPLAATHILEIYAAHRRLLAEPVEVLAGAGFDGCTLLSGRAYQARYPHYDTRVEFDTDLMAPDITTALHAAALLEAAGYDLDTLRVRRLGEAPDGTVEIRRQVPGHRVSVGILIGGYHGHRIRAHKDAETIDFNDRRVRVPSPEDLLVMLAARIERKQTFALVNVNDAAVILSTDGDRLDWDHVLAAARAARLETTLGVVLHHAHDLLGESVVPEATTIALGGSKSMLHRIAMRVAAADMSCEEPSTAERAAKRTWRIDVLRRHLQRDESASLGSEAARRLQRTILKRQVRSLVRAGNVHSLERAATRARTRVGAFCEIAPHLAGTTGCMSQLGPWRGSARARALLRACADEIEPADGPHRCSRLIFDLSDRHGAPSEIHHLREDTWSQSL